MKTIVLALLILAGCQDPSKTPYDLHGWIDPAADLFGPYPDGFGPGARLATNLPRCMEPYYQQMLDGARAWRLLGAYVTINDPVADTINGGFTIVCIRGGAPWLSLVDFSPQQILLNTFELERSDDATVRQVLAGVFGRALGLHHVKEPGAIMFPNTEALNQMTAADVAEYARVFPPTQGD